MHRTYIMSLYYMRYIDLDEHMDIAREFTQNLLAELVFLGLSLGALGSRAGGPFGKRYSYNGG